MLSAINGKSRQQSFLELTAVTAVTSATIDY